MKESIWRVCAFKPFFAVQFLGAFNDNLFKNALVILITFKLSQDAEQAGLLVTLAAGLFILPFMLFSPLAGQLADAYDKRWLIRKLKLAEIGIMLLGAVALIQQALELLLFTLFLMGAQSALFGPIKYAFLPEILPSPKLVQGNALFSGSTFIAILLGTILGGIGVMLMQGSYWVGLAVLLVAIIGYWASLSLGPMGAHPGSARPVRFLGNTWLLVQQAQGHRLAFFALLGISWFWFFGAVILSQIPTLVKYQLGADDQVAVWFLTLFSIGIALGSALSARVFRAQVHLRAHPWLLLLMGLSLAAAVALISLISPTDTAGLQTLSAFLSQFSGWALSFCFLLMAGFGGAYIVPLYTLMQTATPSGERGQMLAVNNLLNATLMVLSSILIMLGLALGLSLLSLLLLLAALNLLVMALFWRRLLSIA
ncbi:MAG: MFS transporter [Thiotrichales bacterium]|nr:MFS transporter [Thiotrichales bacterium]